MTNPAFPLEWASEQPGMQGGAELIGKNLEDAQDLFQRVYDYTVSEVEIYLEDHPDKSTRLHKSLINRLLEPFMWHTVIVTSVDYENFFHQRASEFSPLAQPEIRAVADLLLPLYRESVPDFVGVGKWHLPYIQEDEKYLDLEIKKKISVARCARVSYLTHDGKRDIDKDLELYERLVTARPPHASPLEHVATPLVRFDKAKGNFRGWSQLRHIVGMP